MSAEHRDPWAGLEIPLRRYLDASGGPAAELPGFARDRARLLALYRAMHLTRAFDAKAIALQRTGRLGTYASSLGQEAVAAGLGAAMRVEDVLLPTYREVGAQLLRGVRMEEILLYWGGDEAGMCFAGPREDFPICVPIGTQATQAAGVALAFRLRGEARVAVCACGDGGTSKGDFYEAINFAGVQRLPAVFLINNNQWAISVPRHLQSAARTLAQKAVAAGLPAEQVDGNDVIAVREAAGEAIERARRGEGPSVVEALTYRLGDHTTADDASRYRTQEELDRAAASEPLGRLRRYLESLGAWSEAGEAALCAGEADQIEAAVEAYLATPHAPPETMFDHLYATLPEALAWQRREVAGEPRHG